MKLHISLILSAACVWISPEIKAQTESTFEVQERVAYSDADKQLTLDLFIPSPRTETQRRPCVVVIQGGGFKAQDGQRSRVKGVYFAEQGFVTAVIAYRGRPNHQFRDTINDAKSAVRFLRRNSERFSIDPNRIGAWGHSAGGAIVGMLAVTGDRLRLDRSSHGPSNNSSRIQAAVASAGVFDFISRFTDPDQIELQPRIDSKILANGAWVGSEFSRTDDDWLEASAITHVNKGDSPMLFIHCKDDSTVPWLQSLIMRDRMREAGVKAELLLYETGGHGFKDRREESSDATVAFFHENL